ncbi:hypothetical protein LCGC14_1816110 [marine sediment metagenome]|uniref:Uncharacterized protein n=1 Tax=marine sediment metagenome TaxID=412755 RepID=A0A0F9JJZ9_9ZZZZ
MVKGTLKQIKKDYLDKSIPIKDILDCEDGCPLDSNSCYEKNKGFDDCDEINEQILAEKLIKIGLI